MCQLRTGKTRRNPVQPSSPRVGVTSLRLDRVFRRIANAIDAPGARRTTLETLHRRGIRARLHVLLPLQADLVLLRDEVRHHEERLLLARLRQ